jgi:hypothetical protein
MKIIDKALYIRAIWFVAVGFFAILIAAQLYIDEPKSTKDLKTIHGTITDIQHQDLFSEKIKTNQNSIVIYIDSVVSVYTYYSRHRAILDTINISIGDYCQAWVDIAVRKNIENGEIHQYLIRAMKINNRDVISFKRPKLLSISFFLYSLIIFIPALFFVIKHPEILFGKKKDSNENVSVGHNL